MVSPDAKIQSKKQRWEWNKRCADNLEIIDTIAPHIAVNVWEQMDAWHREI